MKSGSFRISGIVKYIDLDMIQKDYKFRNPIIQKAVIPLIQ